MTGPNTRAGRTLLEAFFTEGGWPDDPEAVILAIEAEAASPSALDVERNLLAEAIFESGVRQTMSQSEQAAENILAELAILRYADAARVLAAEAAAPSALDVPPETEAVRRCVTHHACECHVRLAEIGRRYLAARLTAEQDRGPDAIRKQGT